MSMSLTDHRYILLNDNKLSSISNDLLAKQFYVLPTITAPFKGKTVREGRTKKHKTKKQRPK